MKAVAMAASVRRAGAAGEAGEWPEPLCPSVDAGASRCEPLLTILFEKIRPSY